MALSNARIQQFICRDKCRLRLAAVLSGGALLFPIAAAASDPKSIIQAAGFEELHAGGATETTAGEDAAPPMQPSRRPAEFAGKEGVLALFDGRVVYGTITNAPGGYLLKRPGASDEMIPTFLVQTAADSLLGCYQNLKAAISPTRPNDHLELADWCIRQRLLEEAKTEVLAVLKLDPNRREARELLVKLEEATNPRPRNQESEAAPARTGEGFLDSTGRTTEGVGPELTSQFVRRIQPLMVSKCGNAACHGGDASEQFRIANIRRSSSSGRTTTLENLRQVVTLVDAAEPDRTRLLGALSSPAHLDAFSGPAGRAQEAAIRAWVEGVASEKGLQPVQVASGSVWTPETIALASGESERRLDDSPPRGLQKVKSPPQLRRVDADAGLEQKVLREERPDPFDPGEFNRMVQDRFGAAAAPENAGRP